MKHICLHRLSLALQNGCIPAPRGRSVTFFELQRSRMWAPELDLRFLDKDVLEKDGLLSDRHMFAAHKLLKSQFPGLQGFQSTIFSQNPGNFGPVSDKGMCIYSKFL